MPFDQSNVNNFLTGPVPQLIVILISLFILLVVFPPLNQELLKVLQTLKRLFREVEELPRILEDEYNKEKAAKEEKKKKQRMQQVLQEKKLLTVNNNSSSGTSSDSDSNTNNNTSFPGFSSAATPLRTPGSRHHRKKSMLRKSFDGLSTPQSGSPNLYASPAPHFLLDQSPVPVGTPAKLLVDQETQVSEIDFKVLELRRNVFRQENFASLRTRPEYFKSRQHTGLNVSFNGKITGVNSTGSDSSNTNIYDLNPPISGLSELNPTIDPERYIPPPPPPPPMPGQAITAMEPRFCDAEVQTSDLETYPPLQLATPASISQQQQQGSKMVKENPQTVQQIGAVVTSPVYTSSTSWAPNVQMQLGSMEALMRYWTIEVESVDPSLVSSTRRALQVLFEQTVNKSPKIQLNMKEVSQFLTRKCLITVPTMLLETNNIAHLDLSDNYLTSLPSWFFDSLRSLSSLNLSHNFLSELPEKFIEIKKLKELDISFNQFEYFPASICNLYYLTTLDISNNALSCIHNDIYKLKQTIYELNISNNLLVELPPDFKNLRRLKYLKLNDNNFMFLTLSEVINPMALEESKAKDSKLVGISSSTAVLGSNVASIGLVNNSSSSSFMTRKRSNSAKLDEDSNNNLSKARGLVLLLLLESERRYARFLSILHDLYYIPLHKHLQDVCKEYDFVLSEKLVPEILPVDLMQIVSFTRSFLIRLMERICIFESNPAQLEQVEIGDIYFEHIQNFTQLYASYIHTYDKSIHTLRAIRLENNSIDKFLQNRQRLPISEGMELDSLLVLPLHRIPRHVNILRQLLKITPSTHKDYKNVKQALKLMEQSLEQQNDNFFQVNNKYKIYEIQKKLKIKGLYQPNRYLIREGKLVLKATQEVESLKKMFQIDIKEGVEKMKNLTMNDVKGKLDELGLSNIWEMRLTELPVYVYLFNDIIIVKEIHILQKLIGKFNTYELNGAEVRASEENETQFELFLENRKRTLVFACETKQERMIWYHEIVKVLLDLNQDTDTTSSIDMLDNERTGIAIEQDDEDDDSDSGGDDFDTRDAKHEDIFDNDSLVSQLEQARRQATAAVASSPTGSIDKRRSSVPDTSPKSAIGKK